VLKRSELNFDLLQFCRVMVLNARELDYAENNETIKEFISLETEKRALELAKQIVHKRLDMHPTSRQDDIQLLNLKENPGHNIHPSRYYASILYRIGRKTTAHLQIEYINAAITCIDLVIQKNKMQIHEKENGKLSSYLVSLGQGGETLANLDTF